MQSKKNRFFLGASSLVIAAFLYGFFGIFTRMIGFDLPLFYASLTRNFAGSIILALILYFSKESWQKIKRQDYFWVGMRSLIGMMGFVAYYYSYVYLPVGTVLFLSYATSTIFSYLLGIFLFKEKVTPIKGLSLFLAAMGLFMIYRVSFDPTKLPYLLLALGSGLSTSVWYLFAKKVSGNYSATQLNLLDFMFAFLFSLTASILFKEHWIAPALNITWLGSLLMFLMFVATGQLTVIGFKNVEAQIGSLLMLSEIIFGIVLAWIFFKEAVTLPVFLGGLIIVIAIVLPEIKFKANAQKSV